MLSREGFQRPLAFWLGAIACTVGVLMHLPMYIGARSMGYRMAGMRPDGLMIAGMVLIGFGLAASLYGLMPRRAGQVRQRAVQVSVRPLDGTPLRKSHVAMLVVLAIALTIDIMKPITLSFVAPGMTSEYGLKSPATPHGGLPVSLLPLVAISGTVIGSLMWGALADRIGRRASILYAGILFISTGICGAMPGFSWNLLMCFFMGIAAGGMLPIAYTLIAETIPTRHRGWLMILVGGNVAAAYALTSWLAAELMPSFSWRIMWLIGIPTGLLVIGLNNWIPESARYLLAVGRTDAATKIMDRFGVIVVDTDSEGAQAVVHSRGDFRWLVRKPFQGVTAAMAVLALGVGLVTYGFQLWVPTNLQHLGISAVNVDYIVRNAALIGLPVTLAVALLYGFWSSKKTILLMTSLSAVPLLVFAAGGNSLAHNQVVFSALLVLPLSAVGAVAAAVSCYAAEVYPTVVRSRGTGLIAGTTKAGGVIIIAAVTAAAMIPSVGVTALIGAIPLVVAIAIFARTGQETRRRSLEEITPAAEFVMASAD